MFSKPSIPSLRLPQGLKRNFLVFHIRENIFSIFADIYLQKYADITKIFEKINSFGKSYANI
jgi:hypothetical protein